MKGGVVQTVSYPIETRPFRPVHGRSRGDAERITGPPGKVTGVSPENAAVNQQLDIVITWSRPAMAQFYDVYLDTVNPPVTKVSDGQAARTFVPTLVLDTTYYLRIDAGNTLGTTTGDVTSFSTWAEADIWTDGDSIPWTDGDGNYIPHIAE